MLKMQGDIPLFPQQQEAGTMVEMNKKTRRICVIVLALIIVAVVCRYVGNAGIIPKLAGLIRSGIYLGL